MLRKLFADNLREGAVAMRLRRKRFELLLRIIDQFTGAVRILDVGGRLEYWKMMTSDVKPARPVHVTLLNINAVPVDHPDFASVAGDGRSMPQFADGEFDIVFSNSTIEHVGTFEDQRRMADEVRRIGKAYYVQTPNRYFPIEPHFLFPFFQFLPVTTRVWMVQHFAMGWYPRMRDREAALREVSSIELLGRSAFQQLFPDATIHDERYGGLVQSFVAVRSGKI